MNNTNTQEAPVTNEIVEITPFVADREGQIISRTGKVLGQKFWFGKMSAGELSKHLKETTTLRGNKLNEKVKECLRNEKAMRVTLGHAFVSYMAEKGKLPDIAEDRAKKGKLEFVDAESSVSEATKAKAALAEKDAINEALMARLMALEAAMTEKGIAIPETTAKQD